MSDKRLSIVIPTYSGHLKEIERFLQSNTQFNRNAENTDISLVISSYEIEIFQKFTNVSNVRILIFKDLFDKYFNMDLDENEFLKKAGHVTFQSIKKLVGLLESRNDLIFLTDSETYFIRPCFIIEDCLKTSSVFYSKKLENETQHKAVSLANKVLQPTKFNGLWIGLIFSYQWIFSKSDINLFFDNYGSRILKNIIVDLETFFFIELTIYQFLYSLKTTMFIDVTDLCHEHFWAVVSNNIQNRKKIVHLSSLNHLFCYSVQNNGNIENNEVMLKTFRQFKLLTSTPRTFKNLCD